MVSDLSLIFFLLLSFRVICMVSMSCCHHCYDDCSTEHLNEVSMKACEFQSDNYKLHCGIHVLSRELRGVRVQMAKCKGINE